MHFISRPQDGEDENDGDVDGPEPTENNQLIVDEESEHTMLLGRGGIQQQYKGNHSHRHSVSFICF